MVGEGDRSNEGGGEWTAHEPLQESCAAPKVNSSPPAMSSAASLFAVGDSWGGKALSQVNEKSVEAAEPWHDGWDSGIAPKSVEYEVELPPLEKRMSNPWRRVRNVLEAKNKLTSLLKDAKPLNDDHSTNRP